MNKYMKISNFKNFLNENASINKLTIIDGMVKLWHYSGTKIEDYISISKGNRGLQSKSEYRAWGKSRTFFYATEDGYKYDTGISIDYLYICYIPLKNIYDISKNPNKYDGDWNELYEQSSKDGYTAWIYNLGKNKNVPIVISFIDVPIDESYKKISSGEYIELDKEVLDYKIGTIEIDGEELNIMQKDGYIKSLLNTYLTHENDPIEAMESWKGTLHVYMYKNAKILPKYKKTYIF